MKASKKAKLKTIAAREPTSLMCANEAGIVVVMGDSTLIFDASDPAKVEARGHRIRVDRAVPMPNGEFVAIARFAADHSTRLIAIEPKTGDWKLMPPPPGEPRGLARVGSEVFVLHGNALSRMGLEGAAAPAKDSITFDCDVDGDFIAELANDGTCLVLAGPATYRFLVEPGANGAATRVSNAGHWLRPAHNNSPGLRLSTGEVIASLVRRPANSRTYPLEGYRLLAVAADGADREVFPELGDIGSCTPGPTVGGTTVIVRQDEEGEYGKAGENDLRVVWMDTAEVTTLPRDLVDAGKTPFFDALYVPALDELWVNVHLKKIVRIPWSTVVELPRLSLPEFAKARATVSHERRWRPLLAKKCDLAYDAPGLMLEEMLVNHPELGRGVVLFGKLDSPTFDVEFYDGSVRAFPRKSY